MDYWTLSVMLKTIGAIFSIIGAARIYYKWSNGQREIERDVLLWAGGIVFLFLVHAYLGIMM